MPHCTCAALCRRGLLYEKLSLEGSAKLEQMSREKDAAYKACLGKVRLVPTSEISGRTELHPTLKMAQRRQMEANAQREADKAPAAFTAYGLGEHCLDSDSPTSRLVVCCPCCSLQTDVAGRLLGVHAILEKRDPYPHVMQTPVYCGRPRVM